MKNSEKFKQLESTLNLADTSTAEGRGGVASVLKELYHTIEEDVCNAGAEWMLKGMYNDLCNGNFAEPFMCERKKLDFFVVKDIYEKRILPRL
jgi:hypothetical protein